MNVTRKAVKRFWMSAAVLLAIALPMFGLAPSASAASYGCNYYGWGSYCTYVDGAGTWVPKLRSNFASRSPVCNWDMSAEFFDVNGRWYKTYRTGVHYGCSTANVDDIWVNAQMRTGFVCSTLRSNGSAIASRCASIY